MARFRVHEDLELLFADKPDLIPVAIADESAGECVELAADSDRVAYLDKLRKVGARRNDTDISVFRNDVKLNPEIDISIACISVE